MTKTAKNETKSTVMDLVINEIARGMESDEGRINQADLIKIIKDQEKTSDSNIRRILASLEGDGDALKIKEKNRVFWTLNKKKLDDPNPVKKDAPKAKKASKVIPLNSAKRKKKSTPKAKGNAVSMNILLAFIDRAHKDKKGIFPIIQLVDENQEYICSSCFATVESDEEVCPICAVSLNWSQTINAQFHQVSTLIKHKDDLKSDLGKKTKDDLIKVFRDQGWTLRDARKASTKIMKGEITEEEALAAKPTKKKKNDTIQKNLDKLQKKNKEEKDRQKAKKAKKKSTPRDFSKSNKALVWKAWKNGKGITDVKKLHAKTDGNVKETTIRTWIGMWKRGNGLPAIAKK